MDNKGKSAGKGPLIQIEKSATLAATQDQYLFQPIVFPASGGGALSMTKDLSPTLKAVNYKDPYCVLVEPIGVDMYNQTMTGAVTMTMSAKASDPHHVPCVCYGISGVYSNAMLSSNPHSGIYEADTSRTLDMNGGNPNCNQGGMLVVKQAVLHNGSDNRDDTKDR